MIEIDNLMCDDELRLEDEFASLFKETEKTLFIFPISVVEHDGSLCWHYAIYDVDEILSVEAGYIGFIGAFNRDKAKAVAEHIAVQEAREWINKHFPSATIEVLQEGNK